ncbi:hypothetical protein ABEX69_06765 [Bacillus safensis]|uniref:hypothetical protein n=1 Tax=Bacillus safensis TaxID=561879 RepID=UPI002281FEDD|nr:hypothetical protein [Bacillus safensis]MCY7563799.1 hypothetical protein [Bacillus safensis]MCY7625491.1 hypothetical protein [Bacillus safensis]MCY7632415.1 hypothetical protein [Bacillus safensis]MCY7646827.1 hypothetical protein [Bacillus safensis]MCY7652557.1 hypothetical protein [Bacillus safensis]
MAFTKELPQWDNAGQKPPQSKISEGFKPMDHPPADWFNWYMNGTYEALNELQSEAATTSEVTAALKVLSNDITTHSNAKNNPHAVTKSQVGLGNVDNIKQASKVDFDNHVNDKKIHVTEEKQNLWNNSQLYKLTTDSGFRQAVPNTIAGTNLFELPPGYYYGAGQYFTNLPTTNDTSWFNVDVFSTGIRKNFHVIRSADNTHWVGTIHTDGSFRGWKKILTAEDMENSTFVDTYDQDNSSVSAAENVATKLVFGATRADDLSEYNRSRAEITLKNSGLYLIRLYITSTNITVGSDNILACYVNGSEYQRFGNWNPATSSSTCVLYLLQKFKAGDKVTFYITPRGTNKTISINTAYVTMSQLR